MRVRRITPALARKINEVSGRNSNITAALELCDFGNPKNIKYTRGKLITRGRSKYLTNRRWLPVFLCRRYESPKKRRFNPAKRIGIPHRT